MSKVKSKFFSCKILIPFLIIFFLTALCLAVGIQEAIFVQDWKEGNVVEYKGKHEIIVWLGSGRSYKLKNGDIVTVPRADGLRLPEESYAGDLYFRYSVKKDFLTNSHVAISLSSTDQRDVFLSEESTIRFFEARTITCIALCCTLFVVLLLLILIFFLPRIYAKRKKIQNKMKKRRKMSDSTQIQNEKVGTGCPQKDAT